MYRLVLVVPSYDSLLIDPTWGAGIVSDGKFVRSTDNSMWFDVSPYWMAFSHYPDNYFWTKLDISIPLLMRNS